MKSARVIIADSVSLVRIGLRCLLASKTDCELIGEATNEEKLSDLLLSRHPDVLILDYSQAPHFTEATLDMVARLAPSCRLLIISGDENRRSIYRVLESDVNSYLSKYCDEKEILDAISATLRGERFYCSKVLNYLFEKSFPKGETCEPTPLTHRELEIVQLVADGLIAKEIASKLNLSTHTVYTHRKNIMRKLKLGTMPELVRYAIEEGLV